MAELRDDDDVFDDGQVQFIASFLLMFWEEGMKKLRKSLSIVVVVIIII